MATPTMTPLANFTLPTNQTSVTISNISQNYRDLMLVFNGTQTGGSLIFNINGDTGSNYAHVDMIGNGTGTFAHQGGSDTFGVISGWYYAITSGNAMHSTAHFLEYSKNDKHKTFLVRGNVAAQFTEMQAGRWASTAPITSMTIYPNSAQSLIAGSTFTLYGVIA